MAQAWTLAPSRGIKRRRSYCSNDAVPRTCPLCSEQL